MDEFLTIPEPSRKQLEAMARECIAKFAHDALGFTPEEQAKRDFDDYFHFFYSGHASRDAEVAQLKDLLERAKWPIENYERIRSFMFREGQGPQWSEAWLADYERMEKGGRG